MLPAHKPLRVDLVTGVRDEVKRRIVTGELSPGAPLRVANLAARLDVSSSPIREALRLLERDGLVEIVPFRGARVRPLEQGTVADVYELREFLEEAAIRKVGPSFPAEALDKLQALCAGQKTLAPDDRIGFLDSDIEFHQTLVDMAGNKRMSEMFATLVNQGICFALGREPQHLNTARQAHCSLLKALQEGETQKAVRVLKTHLRDTMKEWVDRAGESNSVPRSSRGGRSGASMSNGSRPRPLAGTNRR